jgi:hypothetical protein
VGFLPLANKSTFAFDSPCHFRVHHVSTGVWLDRLSRTGFSLCLLFINVGFRAGDVNLPSVLAIRNRESLAIGNAKSQSGCTRHCASNVHGTQVEVFLWLSYFLV